MFDFVNVTYSGLLSVVVAIIGLSCPLIIGRIENIDKHYSSTLLAKRFITETAFVLFAVCMVINILVATLFPFVLDCSEYARIWIAVQSILVFLLIVSLLLLFYYMLIYTSPKKLSEHIISHYNKVKKKEAKKLGWKPILMNLHQVTDKGVIGGDIYRNKDGKLPSVDGRIWYEADINYTGGIRNSSRILYSNDGLVFVTYDHYFTFNQIC